MSLLLLAAAALAASDKPNGWTVLDDTFDGTQFCVLVRTFEDDTTVSFVVDDTSWEDGMFVFHATNQSWSIASGQHLGDITLETEAYQFGAAALGGNDHDFYFAVGLVALDPFLTSVKESGFKIIRKGTRVIGNYDGGDLAFKMPEFQDCLDRHFDQPDDPFAD